MVLVVVSVAEVVVSVAVRRAVAGAAAVYAKPTFAGALPNASSPPSTRTIEGAGGGGGGIALMLVVVVAGGGYGVGRRRAVAAVGRGVGLHGGSGVGRHATSTVHAQQTHGRPPPLRRTISDGVEQGGA